MIVRGSEEGGRGIHRRQTKRSRSRMTVPAGRDGCKLDNTVGMLSSFEYSQSTFEIFNFSQLVFDADQPFPYQIIGRSLPVNMKAD